MVLLIGLLSLATIQQKWFVARKSESGIYPTRECLLEDSGNSHQLSCMFIIQTNGYDNSGAKVNTNQKRVTFIES